LATARAYRAAQAHGGHPAGRAVVAVEGAWPRQRRELAPTTTIEIVAGVADELRSLVAPFGAEVVGHSSGCIR
jgi:hypothetical protein